MRMKITFLFNVLLKSGLFIFNLIRFSCCYWLWWFQFHTFSTPPTLESTLKLSTTFLCCPTVSVRKNQLELHGPLKEIPKFLNQPSEMTQTKLWTNSQLPSRLVSNLCGKVLTMVHQSTQLIFINKLKVPLV